MSNRFEKRFENFEQTPPEESWSNIQSNLSKTKFNWLAFSTIIGAIVLVSLTTILFLPTNSNKTVQKDTINNKEINPNVNTQNEEKGLIAKNDNQLFDNSKQDINTNFDNLSSENTSTSNSILLVPTTKKINTPIENSFQLKEVAKISQNEINSDYISQKNNKTNETSEVEIENQNYLENKVISEEDTISQFRLFIPNAFTPSLESNNIFKPSYVSLKSYEMRIYHRNGNLVFTSKDINYGWNGQYKGKLCEQGAYVYIVKFINLNGEQFVQKGTVNLIR
ncbi:MAG: gliding motility-associated C-terminal domain-containing protein [Bacteroidaceae bacterium]|nr:gliding motility-associated C-terminal domain-containing protein [Bacteroidaceae bacterium]MEA5100116.1 gliding motility-associated C-terminal domain-containing protein [Bacteroidales bacterium]